MTIELDESTGLPVVPEGYFWRVRRGDGMYSSRLTLRVALGRYEEVTEYFNRLERVGWWPVKRCVQVPVTRLKFVVAAAEERNVAYATPAVVREMAEKALENWGAEKLDKSLMGDYPPNKIEEAVNAG